MDCGARGIASATTPFKSPGFRPGFFQNEPQRDGITPYIYTWMASRNKTGLGTCGLDFSGIIFTLPHGDRTALTFSLPFSLKPSPPSSSMPLKSLP